MDIDHWGLRGCFGFVFFRVSFGWVRVGTQTPQLSPTREIIKVLEVDLFPSSFHSATSIQTRYNADQLVASPLLPTLPHRITFYGRETEHTALDLGVAQSLAESLHRRAQFAL